MDEPPVSVTNEAHLGYPRTILFSKLDSVSRTATVRATKECSQPSQTFFLLPCSQFLKQKKDLVPDARAGWALFKSAFANCNPTLWILYE